MILCLKCRRVWPKGTVWCGHCRATLGCRVCPEGHVSHLGAKSCTTCGSPKLTPGVPGFGLRGVSWLVIVTLALAVTPVLLHALTVSLLLPLRHRLCDAWTLLVGLAFFCLVFWPLFNEEFRSVVLALWIGLGRLLLACLSMCARIVARAFRRKP